MLVVGLLLSIVLMAIAATYIAKLLARYHWITWIGLAIILFVGLDMVWRGSSELQAYFAAHGGMSATFAQLTQWLF